MQDKFYKLSWYKVSIVTSDSYQIQQRDFLLLGRSVLNIDGCLQLLESWNCGFMISVQYFIVTGTAIINTVHLLLHCACRCNCQSTGHWAQCDWGKQWCEQISWCVCCTSRCNGRAGERNHSYIHHHWRNSRYAFRYPQIIPHLL